MKTRLRRDGPIFLLLLFLLGITSVATYLQLSGEADHPALSALSSEPDGARALRLWLEAMELEVQTADAGQFGIPEESGLAFILEPQLPGISDEEWQTLEEWLDAGGVLLLAGEGFGAAVSMQHWGFDIAYRTRVEGELVVAEQAWQPLMPAELPNLQPRAVLQPPERAYAPILTIDDELVVASLNHGQGRILLTTLAYPFTNIGLKEAGNPEFVLGLLSAAGETGSVWFDEWHHGVRSDAALAPAGMGSWLRTTRPGQTIVYITAVVFGWLLISGARFGKAVPLQDSHRRRPSADHIRALASLSQQAGHVGSIGDYFRREVKRHLGSRSGLTEALPDEEFVEKLRLMRPDLDHQRLAQLLSALRREQVREDQMLHLAQEASAWINQ